MFSLKVLDVHKECAHCCAQESDLKQIFEPFGAVDYITLQHDGAGRSQGFGFVQCAPLAASPDGSVLRIAP